MQFLELPLDTKSIKICCIEVNMKQPTLTVKSIKAYFGILQCRMSPNTTGALRSILNWYLKVKKI